MRIRGNIFHLYPPISWKTFPFINTVRFQKGFALGGSKKYKGKTCVYCRNASSTTADHVFPREIFQPEQRDMLPKVPSCKKCNNEKSQLEQYILSVLPFGATHSNAKKALSADVKKRLGKNKKLHRKIKEEFGYTYIPTPGKKLERRLQIKFDGNILHKFIGFVGRGLIWHHWQKLLPLSCSFKVFTPSPTGVKYVTDLFNLSSNLRVDTQFGDNTVRYKGVMSEIDEGVSVWAIQLLGGITISSSNSGNIFNNSFVTMITGTSETLEKLKIENAT
ncbi:MAG: hypothetical protein GY834_08445 [Bacteroidetes bacterium]|nr:hypothetical protein [Bacteroidota bacterium]